MVLVVTAADRPRHASLLADMHRHRRQVFVDRFGWELPVAEGGLEIDQFDGERAVYLLALDEAGRLTGSLRLLPSQGPHLLGDIFPYLCEAGVPRGEDVWEVSRFCTDPELADPRLARKQLLVGLVEYALLYGVSRFTCVTHMVGLQQLVGIGWDATPLGLPQGQGAAQVGALAIDITPETLKLLRGQAGFTSPVLRWDARHAA
jgi:N-acyl-L-homoserine lactone synthetase